MFATLVGRNVPLGELKEAGQAILSASRAALAEVEGYVVRFEASDPGTDDYHPHVHAIADLHPSHLNPGFEAEIEDRFLSALPRELHSVQNPVHLAPVRSIDASAMYLTKSAFAQHNVERALGLLETLRGVKLTSSRGSFRAES